MSVVREAIVLSRRDNPCATLSEIGLKCGVTRERVRQILSGEGLPTKHVEPSPFRYFCLHCGRPSKGEFCNRRCQAKYNLIPVACAQCDKIKYVKLSVVIYHSKISRYKGRFFCNKRCQGLWLGRNHGFGVHPEHRGVLSGPKLKYDYAVLEALIRKGLSNGEVLREMGMPTGSWALIAKLRLKLALSEEV